MHVLGFTRLGRSRQLDLLQELFSYAVRGENNRPRHGAKRRARFGNDYRKRIETGANEIDI